MIHLVLKVKKSLPTMTALANFAQQTGGAVGVSSKLASQIILLPVLLR